MPDIVRTCNITGKQFTVSELEQQLRASFDVGLSELHPTERMRELLAWRNIATLYPIQCSLCSKQTLSFYNPENTFPKYCKECFYSEAWEAPSADIDFTRPFFEQIHELYLRTPSLALSITPPMENSDFCNAATAMKNCYLCFNAGSCENCMYVYTGVNNKECLDLYAFGNSEMCYESAGGGRSYRLFWSQWVISCSESYFLYDCQDCTDCCMSVGLRHKKYVFRNVQLSKDEYEKRMAAINFGSHSQIQELLAEYRKMKGSYPKKSMNGISNEHVSGNYLYRCKDVLESYTMDTAERCVNCYNLLDRVKDCLDVCSFGYGLERAYYSSSVGMSFNVRYCFICVEKSSNLEYCMEMRGCHDCFGSAGLRKKEYCILNKQYSKEEYAILKGKLIEHMKETGEYGHYFPKNMSPFGYNETEAQLALPLTREQAQEQGYRWYEKSSPTYSQSSIAVLPDTIDDTDWEDVKGKIIVCQESGRPFKIIKQEFDFYKKHGIPVPRLHPDARLAERFPTGELYNLHSASCVQCSALVETSMKNEDAILCESCYQKTTV
ncbi:hypothetical protein HY620_01520 [Candidatus Uhrbacteria bacterium]|nr:hypothetical protein [Candidatus Uhrbacteria bacterium]